MPIIIRVPFNAFAEVEKLLKHRFWDKERERSQRAARLVEAAKGTRRRCPLRHSRLAWSGPPHDPIRCYICLDCNAAASEPEIRDRGYDFETVPDWILVGWVERKDGTLIFHPGILDDDLQRQAELGNPSFFGGWQENPLGEQAEPETGAQRFTGGDLLNLPRS